MPTTDSYHSLTLVASAVAPHAVARSRLVAWP